MIAQRMMAPVTLFKPSKYTFLVIILKATGHLGYFKKGVEVEIFMVFKG